MLKKQRFMGVLLMALMFVGGFMLFSSQKSEASPAGGFQYTVQYGDTVWDLAVKSGTTVGAIASANGPNVDYILPGQVLWIPTGDGSGYASSDSGSWSAGTQGYHGSGDAWLLAQVISAEAKGEPYQGQVAVGAVILNRTADARFPHTVSGVVYDPGAFESVSIGAIYDQPADSAIRAAHDALAGWDPSYGAVYFFNPGKTSSGFMWSRTITTQIGNHVFAR